MTHFNIFMIEEIFIFRLSKIKIIYVRRQKERTLGYKQRDIDV